MSQAGYHETIEQLSDDTKDMHRATESLREELEAMDRYNQRIDVCNDPELRQILIYNRDEEKEHAAMLLEWMRKQDPHFENALRDWLFTDKVLEDDSNNQEDDT